MHHQQRSEVQGAWDPRTPQTQVSARGSPPRTSARWGSPRLERGSGCCRFPLRGALLWAGLLLWALGAPGAWAQLTEEQQETIVELHNYYRGQVSPSASAMMPLKWDNSLKVLAEGYAAKCIWNHNPELEETGENLFAGTGPFNPGEALEKWFLEHLDFSYENNSCHEEKMCGHYTQMVWADTHRVGCALHVCDAMDGLDFERTNFLVCNYYPAGNYEGERLYEEGDWCSRCPENLSKCQDNLCVPDSIDEEEEDPYEGSQELRSSVPPPMATSEPPLAPEAPPEPTPTPVEGKEEEGGPTAPAEPEAPAGPEGPDTLHPNLDTSLPLLPGTVGPPPADTEQEQPTEEGERGGVENVKWENRGRESSADASFISPPGLLTLFMIITLNWL